jgi:hypothetical protein
MNTLSYRRTEENGLSFELVVDGKPLAALVGAVDGGIPYWIIRDDLPYLPPHGAVEDPELRIVCCCSCGEYGCGHTQCRVLREGDDVVFRDFDIDVSGDGRRQVFRFPESNHRTVVSEIVAAARAHAEQERKHR